MSNYSFKSLLKKSDITTPQIQYESSNPKQLLNSLTLANTVTQYRDTDKVTVVSSNLTVL